MAMAGVAQIVAMPTARLVSSAPADALIGARSGGSLRGSGGFRLHRCSAEFRDGSPAGAQCGWRAGGLGGLGLESGLVARRNRIVLRRNVPLRVAAEKVDLTQAAGNLLRITREGYDTVTKLVPEAVPRPVARAGVGLVAAVATSILLKSLFSTVTYVLVIGAIGYIGYFFFLRGNGNSSSGNGNGSDSDSSDKSSKTDDALEAARKIIEKYK